jgi:formyltetrahydrofolate deformylase
MSAPRAAILLTHCADQTGLVAAITEFVARNGGNILSLEQHVDPHASPGGEFFMRVAWSLERFAIPDDKIAEFFEVLIARRFGMTFSLHFSEERLRVALFTSKTTHCLYDILSRVRAGEWHVDIPLIVSNHPDHAPIARDFGVPFVHLPVPLNDAQGRAAQERDAIVLCQEHQIDLVVLARYMVIVGAPFIEAYATRMINIHHAFLPAFIGAKPYHRAYERGVKLIGATAHYVTADLDEGPIIEQDVARVSHLDTIEELTRKGFDVEKIVLARAIRRHIERKTMVFRNRVIVFA